MAVVVRRVVALLLLAVLAVLPFGVYAEPFDPTWLGGFWEDDDADTLALHVTQIDASLPEPVPAVTVTTTVGGIVPLAPDDASLPARPLPFHRRGPPRA